MKKSTFQQRKQNVIKSLTSYGVDALLVEFPIDLLYLTGLHLSAGKLILSSEESVLFVDGRYLEVSQTQTLYPVLSLESLTDWLKAKKLHSLGFDQKETSFFAYTQLQQLSRDISKQSVALDIIPLSSPIALLRLIKSEDEIQALRQSASLGKKGIDFIISSLREGIREIDLAFELEFFWRKHGASQLAFPSIIAFGANSAMPHHRACEAQLTQNTVVLIDVGCILNDYPSDMTRMAFFGSVSEEIQKIFDIVQEAKNIAFAACKKGLTVGELDRIARNFISEKGYGPQFMHSLGHGIGLEVHEMPTVRDSGIHKDLVLQPGMVITIEPGIYLKGIGGVRLEDMFLITETGCENLSSD